MIDRAGYLKGYPAQLFLKEERVNEFTGSVLGSAVVGGLVTLVANGAFNQHWNFFIVWLIFFAVYWLLRFGAGADIDF